MKLCYFSMKSAFTCSPCISNIILLVFYSRKYHQFTYWKRKMFRCWMGKIAREYRPNCRYFTRGGSPYTWKLQKQWNSNLWRIRRWWKGCMWRLDKFLTQNPSSRQRNLSTQKQKCKIFYFILWNKMHFYEFLTEI